MVTELFMRPFVDLIHWLLDLLPDHELSVPAIDTIVSLVQQLNSVIPIGPVIQLAVMILGFGAIFITIRVILMVRHVVLP